MSTRPNPSNSFDFIVVGAGAAGCVIASRLSEEPSTNVLLIEAGSATMPTVSAVLQLWPTMIGTSVDWGSRRPTRPRRSLRSPSGPRS